MKKLLPLALLSTSVMGQECPSFSIEQLHVLQQAHDYGEKYNLGVTLPSIAWVESRAGEVLVNLNNKNGSSDVGVFQINMKTASNMEGVKSPYRKNMLASKLITDVAYSASLAVRTLNYWGNYHKGDWGLAIQSYNAGFAINNGLSYRKKVVKAIHMIERCVKL